MLNFSTFEKRIIAAGVLVAGGLYFGLTSSKPAIAAADTRASTPTWNSAFVSPFANAQAPSEPAIPSDDNAWAKAAQLTAQEKLPTATAGGVDHLRELRDDMLRLEYNKSLGDKDYDSLGRNKLSYPDNDKAREWLSFSPQDRKLYEKAIADKFIWSPSDAQNISVHIDTNAAVEFASALQQGMAQGKSPWIDTSWKLNGKQDNERVWTNDDMVAKDPQVLVGSIVKTALSFSPDYLAPASANDGKTPDPVQVKISLTRAGTLIDLSCQPGPTIPGQKANWSCVKLAVPALVG